MRKRPLCMLSLFLLGTLTVLSGGFRLTKDWNPSAIEKTIASKEHITVSGTVYKREEKTNVQALYIKEAQIVCQKQILKESKLLVYIKPNLSRKQVKIGNQVAIEGTVSFFESARNPGNFDQEFYYRSQGIHALIWAEEIEVVSAETKMMKEKLTEIKNCWKHKLIQIMGEYYGNSTSAILLGEKNGLDETMKESFRKNGIGHILAISGLHMSFIGMGLYKIQRRFGFPFFICGGSAVLLLLFYTVMTGAGISSRRALLMFGIRMGAEITGRNYDIATSLSLTAAVLAITSPLSVMDASFQLSFGAIAGLVLLTPILEESWMRREEKENEHKQKIVQKCRVKLKQGICASMAVNLFLTAPLMYFYFEIPTYSLLLNVLVIPLMPFFMAAGLTGSVLLLFAESAGEKVLFICKGILWFYDRICSLAERLPGNRIVTGRPQKVYIVLYYSVILGICIWFYCKNEQGKSSSTDTCKRQRRRRTLAASAGVLGAAFGFLSICICSYRICTGIEMTVLDVGQGDGIFIRGPEGKCYLIDGGSSDVSSVGKYRIEPYLLSRAADTLDYVFLSHGDEDHVNGIEELLANQALGIRIKNLVLPPKSAWDERIEETADIAVQNQTRIVLMGEGDSLKEEEMTITCMYPETRYSGETGNAASMVLDISYGKFQCLLTGDIEAKSEAKLLKKGLQGKYDVLKVAHHGSKGSSQEAFLEEIRPTIALVSAGIDNRYGHPHEETVKRLKKYGCKVYSTQDNGAITIKSDGKSMQLNGYILKKE